MFKLAFACFLTLISEASARAAVIVDTLDSGPSASVTTPNSSVPAIFTGTGASVFGQTANRTLSILTLDFTNTDPFNMTVSFANSALRVAIGPGQGFDINVRSSIANPYILQPSDKFLVMDLPDVRLAGGFGAHLEINDLPFVGVLHPLSNPIVVPAGNGLLYYFPINITGFEVTGWNFFSVVGNALPNGSSFTLREAYFTDVIASAPVPEPALFLPLAVILSVALRSRHTRN